MIRSSIIFSLTLSKHFLFSILEIVYGEKYVIFVNDLQILHILVRHCRDAKFCVCTEVASPRM